MVSFENGFEDISFDAAEAFDEMYKSYSADGLRELAKTLYLRNEELGKRIQIMRDELAEQETDISYLRGCQDSLTEQIIALNKQIKKYKMVVRVLSTLI